MHQDLEKVLFTEQEIREAAQRIAAAINADYAGQEVTFVGLLKGSVQFMADLIKYIDLKCTIDFMCVSSYGNGSKSTGRRRYIRRRK